MPFKMHKIIFFARKKMCLPYLVFSDLLPETHIFYLALEYFYSISRMQSPVLSPVRPEASTTSTTCILVLIWTPVLYMSTEL